MTASRRTARTALLTSSALLALAAPATAQSPTPTPTPTPPAPAPTPAPPAPEPAEGKLTVAVKAPQRDGGRQIALRRQRVRVTGTLTPFVAGQQAVVRIRHGRKTVLTRTVAIGNGPGGKGRFRLSPRLRRAGTLTVQATHAATPELRRAQSRRARVLVLRPRLGHGARGPLVRIFQRRLRGLRYAAAVTGVYDDRTGRAVMAWRKVNGRARLVTADEGVVRGVLARRGAWQVRHPRAGRHVEVDLSQQVLSLVDGRRVVRTYHTSSGAPATPTVIGTFRFYRKDLGTNQLGMVDAAYFIRGYAIHGYVSVPPYNASHGCLRVPVPDARTIYDWIRLGDRIFVER